jgi:hypothetical protein
MASAGGVQPLRKTQAAVFRERDHIMDIQDGPALEGAEGEERVHEARGPAISKREQKRDVGQLPEFPDQVRNHLVAQGLVPA